MKRSVGVKSSNGVLPWWRRSSSAAGFRSSARRGAMRCGGLRADQVRSASRKYRFYRRCLKFPVHEQVSVVGIVFPGVFASGCLLHIWGFLIVQV
ncbi:hypothetical protein Micbo1qcDRAFT_74139 [Microdochium bolleyi]|uniref:Uncharacterized protein n=1 Tax=Microdochium bolleyi TaxID=196109 RepID=A0A136IZF9_9PEZI|nr:hypothetical protein Micbo1qcDRAFT_74139 [Microdochium bolleyi]